MTPEEVGKLGNAIYEEKIRHQIEPVEHAVSVAIDVHSGNWAVLEGEVVGNLWECWPNARIFLKRVAPPPQFREVEVNGEVVQVLVDSDYFRRPRFAYGTEKMMRDLATEQQAAESD